MDGGYVSWPVADATALDRARAVARTYRAALLKIAPQQTGILDDAARRVGEGWVCGVDTGERVCTVPEAALMLGLTDRRVRQLVDASTIPSQGRTTNGHVLRVADVLAYQAQRRVVAQRQTSALPLPASGRRVSAARSGGHDGQD
jgi:hypothetical protein